MLLYTVHTYIIILIIVILIHTIYIIIILIILIEYRQLITIPQYYKTTTVVTLAPNP